MSVDPFGDPVTTMDNFNFGERFKKSGGKPIVHQGRQLIMADRIAARLGQQLNITIESTSSPHPQGVGMSKGVQIFGSTVKRAVVWDYFSVPPDHRSDERSRLPYSFAVTCRNKSGFLLFYNMTEYMGRQEWWHGGAAMFVEELPNGRRYWCNDFELDDDFDDLVFTIEW